MRLPVLVGSGVANARPTGNLSSWVDDDHQKLSYSYDLAYQKMRQAADRKANAAPLLLGDRVWVCNRNRQCQGKLDVGCDPEPQIIIEPVGDTGLLYKFRPEKGGREKVLHRNSKELCTAPQVHPPVA